MSISGPISVVSQYLNGLSVVRRQTTLAQDSPPSSSLFIRLSDGTANVELSTQLDTG